MEQPDRKKHWENIYETKELTEVSWYQPTPTTSLELISELSIPKSATIIDVGGGDSFLVDHLLVRGFENISVLDISAAALERAKERLGESANKVKWIVADIASFKPTEKYDLWHDRAVFHFLTSEKDISNYIKTINAGLRDNGKLVIGTFSEQGPKKCSGLEITQYSEAGMTERFDKYFEKIRCLTINHKTPFETIQNFTFCSFGKKSS